MSSAPAIASIACALLVAACGSGRPASSPTPRAERVVEFPDEPAGSMTCDGFEVSWSNPVSDESEVLPGLRARRDDRVVLDLHTQDAFERLDPIACGDLDADGEPDLLFERFTGGAHCCFVDEVVPLDAPESRLLQADLGNYGGLEARQLDDDPASELVGSSDLFAYFHLSFAVSPAIPLAYDFDGSTYVVATGDFPRLVRDQIDDAFANIETFERQDAPPDVLRGAALGVYGSYLILGRGPEGIHEIERRVPSGVAAWLRGVAAEAEQLFSERYGAAGAPTGSG